MVFTAGQRVTAAALNAIGGVQLARKSTDKTVNNSTAPSNDTQLQLSVVANALYEVDFLLIYSASTVADVKFTLTGPAGATGEIAAWNMGLGTANAFDQILTSVVGLGSLWSAGAYGAGSTNKATARPTGTLAIGATAGNITLQFCQFIAEVSDAVLYANSRMKLTRVS